MEELRNIILHIPRIILLSSFALLITVILHAGSEYQSEMYISLYDRDVSSDGLTASHHDHESIELWKPFYSIYGVDPSKWVSSDGYLKGIGYGLTERKTLLTYDQVRDILRRDIPQYTETGYAEGKYLVADARTERNILGAIKSDITLYGNSDSADDSGLGYNLSPEAELAYYGYKKTYKPLRSAGFPVVNYGVDGIADNVISPGAAYVELRVEW